MLGIREDWRLRVSADEYAAFVYSHELTDSPTCVAVRGAFVKKIAKALNIAVLHCSMLLIFEPNCVQI
jgi:hypothetical protein